MYTQMTFEELATRWLETKRKIVKHSTSCAYTLSLKKHLFPYFGPATEIKEADVQQFVINKFDSGLAKKTIRDMVAVLKSIVKYGGKHKIFPFEIWDIEYPTSSEKKSVPTLSLYNQRKLMSYLTEYPTSQNIGILISLCTGMRIGEICALKWDDIDMHQRIIHIDKTAGRIYNCELKTTERIISAPKTINSCREVPISKELLIALKSIRKIVSNGPYVVGTSDHPKDPRTYRDSFSRLLKRLDIPHVVFHGLRHTFATRCIESQCDYKTVSAILGHSNVSTTLNLYVHPNMDQKRKCIDKMFKTLK